jgi:hypothetical protein
MTRTNRWLPGLPPAYLRRIPWPNVARIGDNEMRVPMRGIVNRIYTFHLCADEPGLQTEIDRWMAAASRWDEPEIDPRMIAGRTEPH